MNSNRIFLFLIFLSLLIAGCGTEEKRSVVIIGISADPESLNPLYSFSGFEMAITDILYPSLVQHHWDKDKGEMMTTPLLAEKWEWSDDSASVRIFLRKDITWSDGKNLTAEDVIFSFDLFSDPVIQSRLYGIFNNFNTDEDMKIVPGTFDIENAHVFTVYFREGVIPSIIDIEVPVLPAHIFGSLEKDQVVFSEKDITPVTCGAYNLKSWSRNQSVILEKNVSSFLVNDNTPDEVVFRIIPDYNARLTQLRNGEIDLVDDIRINDVERLRKENLIIDFIKGREYDYIGWNNIDPVRFTKSGDIVPNRLFNDPAVRRALTMSVNRMEILKDYMLNYGEVASSPVSPIFREAINRDLHPLEYNPSAAREILKSSNWVDNNRNGIIDRNGAEFSFILNIPSGNPRREFAAVVIRNNLKLVGIDVKIEPLEPSVFFEKLLNRELNAWIAGWSVPIPPDLKPFWYSDSKTGPFNVVSYNNSEVDMLLNSIEKERNPGRKNILLHQVQQIIYTENPVTFLYWVDNIVAYNKRIKDISITPLGAVHNIWEWQIDE
jgi:peptide/nickel transport system substrate-binding protein